LAADFIFDAGRKTVVKLTAKGTIAPSSDERSESVEFDDVLHDALTVAQVKLLELSFGISNGVVRTEVLRKLEEELVIVI
jgi:hypothetical protein